MKAIFPILIFICFLNFTKAQLPPIPNLPGIGQEKAGFNLDSLRGLYSKISNTEHKDFTGLVVIKDSQLAIEWHFNTYWRNQILDIRSASKSITSLLLGIAIKEGLIESIDQDVYSFFSENKNFKINKQYQNIKIKHLLDMSGGLDADTDNSETPGHAVQWGAKDDYLQYILNVPVIEEPGSKWVYADINVAMVGAIIEQVSGKSLKDYAREKLFDPLGIKQFYWYTNEANQTTASGTLYISTLDFAKIGVLVANEGKWGNNQIVNAEYIDQLINRNTFDLKDYWNLTDSYGMLWYKKKKIINGKAVDYVWASGRGGNQLIVIPKEKMVIALTSTAYGPRYGHSRAHDFMIDLLSAYY